MIPAKSGDIHSDEEWEAIRDKFILLYKTEHRSLPEVRKLLSDRLGFHATLRQYKRRVIKWGVPKKGARKQPPEELKRDVRKPITVPVRRQPDMRVARCPRPPGHLETIQVATYGMRSFYSGVLQGDIDRSEVRTQNPDWNIRMFFDTATSVSVMASHSRWQRAQTLYTQLLEYAVPILEDRNPIVLVCLLQVCARFYQNGQGAVLHRFLGFLVAMSSVRGWDNHPLRFLATAWLQSNEHSLDLVNLCSRLALDIMNKELGPEHPQTLSAWRALFSARYAQGNYVSALDAVDSAAEIEMELGDYSTIDLIFRKLLCFLAMNDLEAAKTNLVELDAAYDRCAAGGRMPEAPMWRLRQNIQAARGELLRRQLDPKAEEVVAEVVENLTPSADTPNSWVLAHAQKQLECTRASLKQGEVKPFIFIC